jgi:AraC-like DNA-binding protein
VDFEDFEALIMAHRTPASGSVMSTPRGSRAGSSTGVPDALAHAAAGDKLAPSAPISVMAPSLGYESESAFSTAFKPVLVCSSSSGQIGCRSLASSRALRRFPRRW